MTRDSLSPADRFQELFVAVQSEAVFDDSKTFVDCVPKGHPHDILAAYRREARRPAFDLRAFVREHFHLPASAHSGFVPVASDDLLEHIERLWDPLTHETDPRPHGSLLDVPHPFVVPGGRFRELYYWDSYFTMLGLAATGRGDLVRDITADVAALIDEHGHMPNANRTYYLSRSQPPVFALMVELCEAIGVVDPLEHLHELRREHAWWVDGAESLQPGEARRHAVCMEDGALLARYWDDRDDPREESYREDVATARASGRPVHEVYRDLRAGAASGWDFGSRWTDVPGRLETIRTTTIVPVDLNAFLVRLERLIARLSAADGDDAASAAFGERADARQRAIERWLYSDELGAYVDHDLRTGAPRTSVTAACMVPLYVGCAPADRAARTAATARDRLLRAGGLGTSEHETGEQWDRPNGWAPLQWMGIEGCRRYGLDLADDIRARWLGSVQAVFDREHRLVEKYALVDGPEATEGGGGGEYALQDGFGWTNGVTAALLTGFSLADRGAEECLEPPRR